jgi:hypothetical protein
MRKHSGKALQVHGSSDIFCGVLEIWPTKQSGQSNQALVYSSS